MMSSLITMNIHDTEAIETTVEHGTASCGAYCARVIKITAKDGSRFELTLFADDPGALVIGGITAEEVS